MDGTRSDHPRIRGVAGRYGPRIVCIRHPGFTVVELIAVIILLSILGIFAMGRMTSPAMFAPAVVSQSLIAEFRFAQQIATARHDAVVSVTVDRVGQQWRLRTSTDVDGVLRAELLDADGTQIQATSGAASDNIDGVTPLVLSFDHAGDLDVVTIGAAPGAPAIGVSVTVTGETVRQMCVYPSGYANAAACS